MITKKTIEVEVYCTSDGKQFPDRKQAEEHETELEAKNLIQIHLPVGSETVTLLRNQKEWETIYKELLHKYKEPVKEPKDYPALLWIVPEVHLGIRGCAYRYVPVEEFLQSYSSFYNEVNKEVMFKNPITTNEEGEN